VNLSAIDALMLRPPMLSGKLDASAQISGTSEAPTVAGKFDVTEGAFRQVHFNSFAGTVDYERSGITVDAKLEQSPASWLEAKGYVPVAAFKKSAEPAGATHLEAASKADSFDLHVNSTAIDLGLVQGMTTALTKVSGTVEAKIDITGPAGDPHPGGVVTVKNGALTVVPTGVTYTNLNGRVELEADRIHIADIEVLDNDKQPLSIVGDLAIHEQQLGGVNVNVTARNFKIIKNKVGDLRMDSDLLITGDMLRPRIEGEMGVTSGVINLDPLIESVTGTGGATAETAYTTRGGGRGRSSTSTPGNATTPVDPALAERINTPEGAPEVNEPIAASRAATTDVQPPSAATPARQGAGGFAALKMDVHLSVANDFVVRSNDLSVPDAPIGLGAVNVTIGGDLRLLKNPGRDVVRLIGTVNTVRGTYDFQGRRFTILRDGTIRFEGGRDINPDLSVTAQRAIQGVLANVNVRGTLKTPELVLSSVPPLEQSEILSLIVFNQPINQLGEGQQVAVTQRAQQLAAGVLASTLTNSLGKALNLTEFTIQAGSDSGTAAQITAGEQVNENLYAKVEQGFGDASTTNFVLEYEIAKWLRLRTNWLQGSNAQPLLFQRTQDSGLDLLFTFSR
jgi:autotransporter translocation and assembly factor TamB